MPRDYDAVPCAYKSLSRYLSSSQNTFTNNSRTSYDHLLLSIPNMQFFAPLVLVAATVAAIPTGTSPSTGSAQCCQNVKNSSQVGSLTQGLIFALLGINVSNLNIPIGTGCTPIAILGGVSWYV
jgi:hypothetical protein